MYCSRKQREPLMGFELMLDRHPEVTSQTRVLMRQGSAQTWYALHTPLFDADMSFEHLVQIITKLQINCFTKEFTCWLGDDLF